MTSVRRSGGRKRIRFFNNYFDYTLLFVTVFLVVFGLVMIYSSSSFMAQRNYDDPMRYFSGQLEAAILGFAAIVLVSKIDYKWYTKKVMKLSLIEWLYIVCLILQTVVLFLGSESHGKARWINLGPISFQPSEIAKIAIILFTALLITRNPSKMRGLLGTLAVCLLNGPLIGLVVVGNLSTGIILGMIVLVLCFVTYRRYIPFIGVMLFFASIIVLVIFFFSDPYRVERINIWLNIETHEGGYQIRQGLYAIASGGLFGKGLGESMQKLGNIPEVQNDMIFVVICEELGIVGAIAVILLFILLLYRIFVIAINAPDLFGSLICIGVFTHIAVQVIINIAVVTNSIPSTGIPLPFISYGGTSLSILLAEIGLVLAVSNRIRHERTG